MLLARLVNYTDKDCQECRFPIGEKGYRLEFRNTDGYIYLCNSCAKRITNMSKRMSDAERKESRGDWAKDKPFTFPG